MFFDYFDYLFIEIITNLELYLSILLVVTLTYILVLKKHIYSIFDPIIIAIIAMIFSASNVLFMYRIGMINKINFISFCSTELALLLGIVSFKPINLRTINKPKDNYSNILSLYKLEYKTIYIILSIIFNMCVVLSFYKTGLILFKASSEGRVNLLAQTGIPYYITSSIIPIVIFNVIKTIDNHNSILIKLINYTNIISILAYLILFISSKSSILIIVSILYFYILFLYKSGIDKNIENKLKKLKIISGLLFIVTVFISIFMIFSMNNYSDLESVIESLIYRFVAYGDIYPMYYSSGVGFLESGCVNGIKLIFQPLIMIFNTISGVLSLTMQIKIPTLLGIQLFNTFINPEIVAGPNTRHNIFGLFYFGFYGSIIFSYIIGFLLSFFRNKFYMKMKLTYLNYYIYILCVQGMITSITDPNLGATTMGIGLIVLLISYSISKFIAVVLKK